MPQTRLTSSATNNIFKQKIFLNLTRKWSMVGGYIMDNLICISIVIQIWFIMHCLHRTCLLITSCGWGESIFLAMMVSSVELELKLSIVQNPCIARYLWFICLIYVISIIFSCLMINSSFARLSPLLKKFNWIFLDMATHVYVEIYISTLLPYMQA